MQLSQSSMGLNCELDGSQTSDDLSLELIEAGMAWHEAIQSDAYLEDISIGQDPEAFRRAKLEAQQRQLAHTPISPIPLRKPEEEQPNIVAVKVPLSSGMTVNGDIVDDSGFAYHMITDDIGLDTHDRGSSDIGAHSLEPSPESRRATAHDLQPLTQGMIVERLRVRLHENTLDYIPDIFRDPDEDRATSPTLTGQALRTAQEETYRVLRTLWREEFGDRALITDRTDLFSRWQAHAAQTGNQYFFLQGAVYQTLVAAGIERIDDGSFDIGSSYMPSTNEVKEMRKGVSEGKAIHLYEFLQGMVDYGRGHHPPPRVIIRYKDSRGDITWRGGLIADHHMVSQIIFRNSGPGLAPSDCTNTSHVKHSGVEKTLGQHGRGTPTALTFLTHDLGIRVEIESNRFGHAWRGSTSMETAVGKSESELHVAGDWLNETSNETRFIINDPQDILGLLEQVPGYFLFADPDYYDAVIVPQNPETIGKQPVLSHQVRKGQVTCLKGVVAWAGEEDRGTMYVDGLKLSYSSWNQHSVFPWHITGMSEEPEGSPLHIRRGNSSSAVDGDPKTLIAIAIRNCKDRDILERLLTVSEELDEKAHLPLELCDPATYRLPDEKLLDYDPESLEILASIWQAKHGYLSTVTKEKWIADLAAKKGDRVIYVRGSMFDMLVAAGIRDAKNDTEAKLDKDSKLWDNRQVFVAYAFDDDWKTQLSIDLGVFNNTKYKVVALPSGESAVQVTMPYPFEQRDDADNIRKSGLKWVATAAILGYIHGFEVTITSEDSTERREIKFAFDFDVDQARREYRMRFPTPVEILRFSKEASVETDAKPKGKTVVVLSGEPFKDDELSKEVVNNANKVANTEVGRLKKELEQTREQARIREEQLQARVAEKEEEVRAERIRTREAKAETRAVERARQIAIAEKEQAAREAARKLQEEKDRAAAEIIRKEADVRRAEEARLREQREHAARLAAEQEDHRRALEAEETRHEEEIEETREEHRQEVAAIHSRHRQETSRLRSATEHAAESARRWRRRSLALAAAATLTVSGFFFVQKIKDYASDPNLPDTPVATLARGLASYLPSPEWDEGKTALASARLVSQLGVHEVDERVVEHMTPPTAPGNHATNQFTEGKPGPKRYPKFESADPDRSVYGYYRRFAASYVTTNAEGRLTLISLEDFEPVDIATEEPETYSTIHRTRISGEHVIRVREGETIVAVTTEDDKPVELLQEKHTGAYMMKADHTWATVYYAPKDGEHFNTTPPTELDYEPLVQLSHLDLKWQRLLDALNARDDLSAQEKAAVLIYHWGLAFKWRDIDELDAQALGEQISIISAQTINSNTGICNSSTYGLMVLFRAAGIPTRFVSGNKVRYDYGLHTDVLPTHGWIEFWDGTTWLPVEPQEGDYTAKIDIPENLSNPALIASQTKLDTDIWLIQTHQAVVDEFKPYLVAPANQKNPLGLVFPLAALGLTALGGLGAGVALGRRKKKKDSSPAGSDDN